MADEHFLAAGDFPSGLGTAPFFGSGPYAPPPPGLDAATAAMASFCMLPWNSELPIPSESAATTTAHFDSALSSLVSSPAHASVGDDVAIGDLIGRLGSICSNTAASANNSCYSTPLSSPPRGAALAFRQGGCYPGAPPPVDTGGRLSRVASSKSLGGAAPATMESATDAEIETPAKGGDGSGAARKRKASGKGKTAVSNASPKRSKLVAGNGNEDDDDAAEKEPEPVKDYIHVRARRGQATDSHSLAERVRREKISERMKLLQSLVPGCNKITGKALMLDEIINYVQSLQRQVEFLSMKLSTMNPQLLDVDALQYPRPSDKDTAMLGYPQAAAAASFSYADPFAEAVSMHPTTMESCISSSSFHHGDAGFGDWAAAAQDLQSIIVHRRDHHQQPGHSFCGGGGGDSEPHEGGVINARTPARRRLCTYASRRTVPPPAFSCASIGGVLGNDDEQSLP